MFAVSFTSRLIWINRRKYGTENNFNGQEWIVKETEETAITPSLDHIYQPSSLS